MIGPIGIGLVGLGKIARDQHLPVIARSPDLDLIAVASRNASHGEVPSYSDLDSMLAAEPNIQAVVLCQPPQVRYEAARAALLAGKHVFLEKPPGATLSEVQALIDLATAMKTTLFASWHSREAAAVPLARQWLAERRLITAQIIWKEDVRVWHPGQSWIWKPGGFGVFDPGINALSILTAVVSEPVRLVSAELDFPSNCEAPVAAALTMQTASGAQVSAEFDFLQTGPQTWDIELETACGQEGRLSEGGSRWAIEGIYQPVQERGEYHGLYQYFIELIRSGSSDVDLAPLRLVADAFLAGRARRVEPFNE